MAEQKLTSANIRIAFGNPNSVTQNGKCFTVTDTKMYPKIKATLCDNGDKLTVAGVNKNSYVPNLLRKKFTLTAAEKNNGLNPANYFNSVVVQGGGRRRKTTRKNRKASRKNRKASRKNRKNRKTTRKNRR
jgi:hypothetical protein